MSYKVEQLPDSYAELGEAPHWDIATQSLYFLDINSGLLYRYDYKENKTYQAKIEKETIASFVIPIENAANQFVVGIENRVAIVQWDGKSSKATVLCNLCEVETKENRFNDGKCDPTGRLYSGTMHSTDFFKKRTGSLYFCGDKKQSPKLLKEGVAIANGLTWDLKKKKFYYIDSLDYEVKAYDYDDKTGDIKNEKVLIDFRVNGKEPKFVPDGMTIDTDGNLYVALFGDSKILKINPITGTVDMEIKMPCEQITSVAFGGPNLDILYVTTSAINGKSSPAGQTFKITGLGVKGLEMAKCKV